MKPIARLSVLLLATATAINLVPVASADIFQWEYINPGVPSLGKQQSSTLCADGFGLNASPGLQAEGKDLTTAFLTDAPLNGANLAQASLIFAELTGANLSGANLTGANLLAANLTNANLSGAEVRGARIASDIYSENGATHLTPDQLHSTASYAAHDLTGLALDWNDLTSANFAGQNLTDVSFYGTTLTGVDFTGARIQDAEFSREFNFGPGGPVFSPGAISLPQLYSTESYKNHDLSGTGWNRNDLAQADFSGQDFTGAYFSFANLTHANFTGANLSTAILFDAVFTGANFSGAIVKGADFSLDNNYGPGTGTGLAPSQLYATASYLTQDLANIDLSGNNLAAANLHGQNLTGAKFFSATLTNADLTAANFTNASFEQATLTGANFTSAIITGARFDFSNVTGAQLTATANHQAHDLSGVSLDKTNLTRANFIGQNLHGASLAAATLTAANFTDSDVRGTNLSRVLLRGFQYTGTGVTPAQLASTASYKAKDLTGISLASNNLAGANLAGQNLTDADLNATTLTNANLAQANLSGAFLYGANLSGANLSGAILNTVLDFTNLTGANLSGAVIRGASLSRTQFGDSNLPKPSVGPSGHEYLPGELLPSAGSGITLAQLASTASYAAGDLRDVTLANNVLDGGNFAGFNLTNAYFGGATFVGANLSGADARRSSGQNLLDVTGAIATNLIHFDGHVEGLDLPAGQQLVVRDYDGDSYFGTGSIPITVDQHFAIGSGGTLRMLFEADLWDSTIILGPGIPTALGGTLDLNFAAGVNVAAQVGRTFDLFDWTGVAPIGAFAVASPYAWDLSKLYATGEVTLTAIPEPSPSTLVGIALAPLLIWRRHKRSKLPPEFRSSMVKTRGK